MAKKQFLSFWYVLLAAPTLIFVGIWYFVMKRIGGCMHGGMLKIGKSKARVYMQTETGVQDSNFNRAKRQRIVQVNRQASKLNHLRPNNRSISASCSAT